MKRAPRRTVWVDRGYGPAEHWTPARAISEQMVNTLFGAPEPSLLVELPGGERVWVSSWRDTDPDPAHTPS